MRESMTLDQMGKEISAAIQTLTLAQRRMGESRRQQKNYLADY